MRVKIIKIGNSHGFRIPKPLLQESGVEHEADLKVKRGGGFILYPIQKLKTDMYGENELLNESALAKDWNRPGEDRTWATLNTAQKPIRNVTLSRLEKLRVSGGPKDLSSNVDHYLYDI